MNSIQNFSPHQENEPATPIRIVGVYEDLPSGLRISRLCAGVIERLNHTVHFETDLYSFDLLMLPGAAQTASIRAKRADTIIVSAHRENSIPRRVRKWIESLRVRCLQNDTAWIELLDHSAENQPTGEKLLEQLALEARLQYRETLRETDVVQVSTPADWEPETTLLFADQGSLPGPEWGINES